MIEGVIQNVTDKGFGFVMVEGYDKNIFFHASEVKGIRFEQLRKNDRVYIREILKNSRGFSAVNLSLVEG